jgi:[acyl-carrier-protein] S-malonyltransferase
MRQTIHTQAIVTIYNAAIYKLLIEKVSPDYVIGHSLGEISALYAAGVISMPDLFSLVKIRSGSMHAAAKKYKGAMYAVIGLDIETLKEKIHQNKKYRITIANYNCPGQVVISGPKHDIKEFVDSNIRGVKGVKSVLLDVSGAWHSFLMEEAQQSFARQIEKLNFNSPKIPIIFNTTADVCHQPGEIKKNIIRQFTTPVNWVLSIEKLFSLGVNLFITAGVDKVLKSFILKINKQYGEYKSYSNETVLAFRKVLAELENIKKLNT